MGKGANKMNRRIDLEVYWTSSGIERAAKDGDTKYKGNIDKKYEDEFPGFMTAFEVAMREKFPDIRMKCEYSDTSCYRTYMFSWD